MSVRVVRGRSDDTVKAMKAALEDYVAEHPGAQAELYRYNSVSVRVRVIDDGFAGVRFDKRHDRLWDYLNERLPDEAMSEVSYLIPVTHAEMRRELSSVEFDHPTRNRL